MRDRRPSEGPGRQPSFSPLTNVESQVQSLSLDVCFTHLCKLAYFSLLSQVQSSSSSSDTVPLIHELSASTYLLRFDGRLYPFEQSTTYTKFKETLKLKRNEMVWYKPHSGKGDIQFDDSDGFRKFVKVAVQVKLIEAHRSSPRDFLSPSPS